MNAAEKVFKSQADRDVVTWTTMIGGYVQSGLSFQALQVLEEMQIVGIEPNRVTFLCTLRACSALGNLDLARLLHHRLLNSGFESGIGIKPMLIYVYANCNSLIEAEGVFRSFQNRDDVSVCSAMMCAYAQHGYDDLAFEFLDDKQRIGGEAPNEFMLVCSLNICGKQKCIRKGKEMNVIIMKRGFDLRKDVGNALINMYVNCGCLNGNLAFRCFTKMVRDGFVPNKVAGALKACTLNGDMQVFIVALCSWMGIIINCLEDLRKREIRERWLRTTYAVKSEFATKHS
mgnify:CR=1 FL=1